MVITNRDSANRRKARKRVAVLEREIYRSLVQDGPESQTEILGVEDTEAAVDDVRLFREVRDHEIREGRT